MKKIVFIFHTIICCTIIANAQGNNKTNGTVAIERQDADALLVSNSTIDESYLLGDGAEVTFDGDFIKLAVDGETHQYELSESDALNINFSHTFKLTAIQDPNNTANYFATFYTGEGAYKLPEGTKAYIGIVGKSGENNVVVQNEIDTIIHKGEAVILQTKSENITLMPSSNKNAAAEGNVLTGTDETKNLVTGDYVLFSDLNNIGFHKWDDKTIDANNAYLNFGENKGDIFYLARIVSYVTTDENIKVSNDTVIIDSKITNEPTVSKTGYRLDGWYKESTLENKWDFATEVVTENISLYAQWIQQFTVAFVTNGAAETIESQAIDINQKVTEPSVSKTGCEFRGWYTESTFENQWDFANDVVTANITLYAEWHQHVGVAQSLAATCEGNGYAEHFVCECGKAFTTVDCTTEITDLAAWKVGDGLIPALNHDFALDKWLWNEDKSIAKAVFVCKNDSKHADMVVATITTDTIQSTADTDGKIVYTATTEFEDKPYTDTKEDIIPAIGHEFVFGKWLWSDDKKACAAVFNCINEENHADTVVAEVTADTLKATCTADGLITSYAVATFNGEDYKDTVTTVLPALNHDYALGEWSWKDDNSAASVSFICNNDETHVEIVDAVITTDTVMATCTEEGKISYFAVAIFQSEEYKDTIETILPAINHDFALDKWLWNEDKSIAKAVFVCKNDSKHADTVVATITTDTIQSTADTDGKIVYTATTEFEDKPYTDTKEDIIPAIGHEFVFGEWLWADDKATCAAVFNCINEENHSDTVDAKVTADTLKATCTADGLITSYAVATFNGKDYKDTVTTVLPALNHDYALGEWTWEDDKSAASVSFICKNDNSHVETANATITTDTVNATCTEDGKISYFAVATFQSEEYKDTVVTTIPALSHDFALDKWLWSDDKSQCSAIFVCANDKQHADTVSAVVTSDTTAATLTENGKIVYIASVTYEENNYADTTEVILYPLVSYENIIDMIEGTYTLTSYTGNETNKPAKDLYFKFYGIDTITQGQFNSIEYNNLNVSDLTNIVVSDTKISFDNKSNTTFSFSVDAELNTCTELTIKNSELEQVCVLTKTPVEEINIADIWDIIEGSYINENGKVQNFIMEFDSEMGKDTPCFMWVDQFNGVEGFENVDGYFPLAGDEYISIEKTGNYYDFKISDEKYFTLTIENDSVTEFMTYGNDNVLFKGNYKKLAYSDILEEIQGTYYMTAINGESKTENIQIDFEDEDFIIIRNGKDVQKTPVKDIMQIMYTSDRIDILFKDNSRFTFNIDSDTIANFILTSGDMVLEFSLNNPDIKEPEAVNELMNNIMVFVRNGDIVVSGLSHDDVVIINTIDGKLLYKQLQRVETATYDIYGKGIYFVKVGNRTFTVLY